MHFCVFWYAVAQYRPHTSKEKDGVINSYCTCTYSTTNTEVSQRNRFPRNPKRMLYRTYCMYRTVPYCRIFLSVANNSRMSVEVFFRCAAAMPWACGDMRSLKPKTVLPVGYCTARYVEFGTYTNQNDLSTVSVIDIDRVRVLNEVSEREPSSIDRSVLQYRKAKVFYFWFANIISYCIYHHVYSYNTPHYPFSPQRTPNTVRNL